MGKLQINGDINATGIISVTDGQLVMSGGSFLTKRTFTGGWQIGWTFDINDIQMGKLGFYGGTESMNYFYVGTEYTNTWITVTPEGVVTANTFNGNATSATNSSKLGGFGATEFFRRGDNITTSCNDVTTSRSYWSTNTATEAPTSWGGLLDFNTGSHHQLFLSYTGNESYVGLYTRAKVNGVWQPWSRYLNTDNYSLFALPLSGGTLTGNTTISFAHTGGGMLQLSSTSNNEASIGYNSGGTHYWVVGKGCGGTGNGTFAWWYNPSGKNVATLTSGGVFTATTFVGSLSGNASSASSVPWSGITGKPSSYTPASHSHSYVPLSGGSMSGQLSISINSPGTSPSTQHIILNGQNGSSAVANAPGLAMHIGNMNWSTLKFLSDGSWRFYNNGCNGYMPIYCSKTVVTNYGSSLPSSGATGEIFYKT